MAVVQIRSSTEGGLGFRDECILLFFHLFSFPATYYAPYFAQELSILLITKLC